MLLAARNPEFFMTEGEASQLAEAIANYLRHSKVSVDPKTRDLCMLLFVIATLEGPRIMAVVKRRNAEKKFAKEQAQVNEFSGTNVSPLPNGYRVPGT
jgi:hypothetical protein